MPKLDSRPAKYRRQTRATIATDAPAPVAPLAALLALVATWADRSSSPYTVLASSAVYTAMSVLRSPGLPDCPPESVDPAWFARTAGFAKRRPFALERHGALTVATVGKTGYSTETRPADAPAPRPRGRIVALHPADWSKGGAVVRAVAMARETRMPQPTDYVHLDSLVSATDGHRMMRLVPAGAADMAGADVMVPSELVRRVAKLLACAPVVDLYLRTSPLRARTNEAAGLDLVTIVGRLDDGTSWEVTDGATDQRCPYGDAPVPSETRPIVVDADDLRALASCFKAGTVAIWDSGAMLARVSGGNGLGTTLERMPRSAPAVTVQARYLLDLPLPKRGPVTLNVSGPLDPLTVLGVAVCPVHPGDDPLAEILVDLSASGLEHDAPASVRLAS